MPIRRRRTSDDVLSTVLIVAHDIRWRDLGCHGSEFHETPFLDRLAGEGMRFTQTRASSSVRLPSRASLMTGKHPVRVGITNWIPGNPWERLIGVPFAHALPRGELTIVEVLRRAGYRTWHVGKWHLGPRGH